jgi:HSP20 family protein
MLSLRQAMDRLFEESFVRPRSIFTLGEGPGLPLDVRLTDDAVVVEAALPGVKPDEVDITVSGDSLTISASNEVRQEQEEAGYLYREIRRGSFSRTITLPEGLRSDAARAHFENGLLTLEIPKAEEAKPRQIRITTSDASASKPVQPARPVAAGEQAAR